MKLEGTQHDVILYINETARSCANHENCNEYKIMLFYPGHKLSVRPYVHV